MSQRSALLPIFLIVLVDVLGFTIVIPLLSLYAERFGASPLTATLIVSCYAVCALISTPIIGKLSDTYGRKPLLMISQAGTCLGFIILGTSEALWMVFLGRILDGLTAGNLSIAQAYITDHTTPENRAKSFGFIGIAFGIGFMFGPALGGWLGQYGMHLPFIVAAGLSACSILATHFMLPPEPLKKKQVEDTGPVGPGGKRPGAFDVETYAEYMRRPGLRGLYVQFYLYTFAFSLFISGFALFAERRFITGDPAHPWTAREVGFLFAFAGLAGIIWQGGLIGRLVKKYGEYKLCTTGFIALIFAYALFIFVPAADWTWLIGITILSSFGNGVLRPVLTSRITQSVGKHEQGVAIGISGSLSSLAMMMAPPTGGFLINEGWLDAWPLVAAGVSLIGLVVCLIVGRVSSVAASPTLPKAELHSKA
ncbi:MAG: MFS transporter [Deltaproteobacteria bacterium]|nr:MFS transporter [Deltaproteobacteria bacterium]